MSTFCVRREGTREERGMERKKKNGNGKKGERDKEIQQGGEGLRGSEELTERERERGQIDR